MITRILPPDEWARLEGTEAESVWPMLNPNMATVIVVEEGERIIGTWVLMSVLHAECLWIAPDHRGASSVARRLWTFMQRTAQSMGVDVVATAAQTDDVRGLLEHIGASKLPGDHYTMRMH